MGRPEASMHGRKKLGRVGGITRGGAGEGRTTCGRREREQEAGAERQRTGSEFWLTMKPEPLGRVSFAFHIFGNDAEMVSMR